MSVRDVGIGAEVRVRLVFVAFAVVAAIAVFIVGLLPSAATKSPASSASGAGPSVSAGAAPSRTSGNSLAQSAAALTSKMRLVFDARFRGHKLDKSVWDTCYPWAIQAEGCTNFDNSEAEWYLPSQVRVSGGTLDLVAKRARTLGYSKAGTRKVYQCRSGMVTTHPGFNFKYGYVQVIARIPGGADLWPALWLEASNLQWPPEIDMLEHWGPPASFSGVYLHPVGAQQVRMIIPPSISVTRGWHVFAIDWTRTKLTWYVDGKTILSVDQDIPHQDMFILMDLATFARNGYSACSGTLQVRSVKVWQA